MFSSAYLVKKINLLKLITLSNIKFNDYCKQLFSQVLNEIAKYGSNIEFPHKKFMG